MYQLKEASEFNSENRDSYVKNREAEYTLGKSKANKTTVVFDLKYLNLMFTNGYKMSKHKS